jgi:hypothetical protein
MQWKLQEVVSSRTAMVGMNFGMGSNADKETSGELKKPIDLRN